MQLLHQNGMGIKQVIKGFVAGIFTVI